VTRNEGQRDAESETRERDGAWNSRIRKEKGKETYRSRVTRLFASSRGPLGGPSRARKLARADVARRRANLISFTLRGR